MKFYLEIRIIVYFCFTNFQMEIFIKFASWFTAIVVYWFFPLSILWYWSIFQISHLMYSLLLMYQIPSTYQGDFVSIFCSCEYCDFCSSLLSYRILKFPSLFFPLCHPISKLWLFLHFFFLFYLLSPAEAMEVSPFRSGLLM